MRNCFSFGFFVEKPLSKVTMSETDKASTTSTVETSSTAASRRKAFLKKFVSIGVKIAAPPVTVACGVTTYIAYNRYQASEANNPSSPPSDGLVYSLSGNDYLLAATAIAGILTTSCGLFSITLLIEAAYKCCRPQRTDLETAC